MHHIFFNYSSTDGHIVCFPILTVVTNVTIGIRMHVSFELVFAISLDKYPEMELLGYNVVLLLIF